MRYLGRVVFGVVFFAASLVANVVATVDSASSIRGEMVTYRLSISGEKVERPALSDICGNEIVATGSQTSIESINGNYSKTYTLSYQFMPEKSCTIKPVAVNIDGEIHYSNSVELTIKEPTQDKAAPFVLSLEPSKESLYVGEPFELVLTLTQRPDAQAVDSNFVAPEFKGFWLKSESEPLRERDAENIVTKVHYTLAPQREGNLSITPAQLRVASRVSTRNGWGSFSPQVKWRSFYSNRVALQVKPIPEGASLIGDFTIEANVTKREVAQNEALNLTLSVEGVGNLEDIKSFKPSIGGVSVFDEKISIDGDRLTQNLAFVGNKNFTIPAFELRYFSTKTQKLRTITTKPIEIEVTGEAQERRVEIQRDESTHESEKQGREEKSIAGTAALIAVFIFGMLLGAALMYLRTLDIFKRKETLDINDEKLLLMKLLPFRGESDVSEIMDTLEKNIYSSEKKKIDKKELKEILKRYNIS